MARKYTRDNRGRFASVGATARGSRLKTAGGNKRKSQTIQSKAGRAGTIGKPKGLKPNSIKPKQEAKAKPAKLSKAPANFAKARYKSAQGTARSLSRDLRGASVAERRQANSASAAVRNMERRRSTSTAKAVTDSPRGRQLGRAAARVKRANSNLSLAMRYEGDGPGSKMSRKASVAKRAAAIYSGKLDAKKKTAARLTKSSDQAALSRRIKKIKDNAQSKPAVKKAKTGPKVSDAKISRVINRVNSVVRGADTKSGVKRMNAVEVGQRAKSFLARKAGGVSAINRMGQAESFASVRKAMTKPPRYSTTNPNRNKPGAYNNLGQSSARAKARAAAMTPQQRIRQFNAAKVKPASVASRAGIGSRALKLPAPSVPGYVSGRRVAGTIAKRKTTAKPAVSSTVARTRKQATSVQRFRRNEVLGRTRGWNSRNAGLKRRDTGMRQLSLTGPSKTLYSYKPTKLRRK